MNPGETQNVNTSTRWVRDNKTNTFYKTTVALPQFQPNFNPEAQFPLFKKYSDFADGTRDKRLSPIEKELKLSKKKGSTKNRRSLKAMRLKIKK